MGRDKLAVIDNEDNTDNLFCYTSYAVNDDIIYDEHIFQNSGFCSRILLFCVCRRNISFLSRDTF